MAAQATRRPRCRPPSAASTPLLARRAHRSAPCPLHMVAVSSHRPDVGAAWDARRSVTGLCMPVNISLAARCVELLPVPCAGGGAEPQLVVDMQVVAGLKTKGIYEKTAIIFTAKHGNSPARAIPAVSPPAPACCSRIRLWHTRVS